MPIRPEEYTDKCKAYLTYESNPIINGILLDSYEQKVYKIYKDGKYIHTLTVLDKLAREFMEKDGFEIKISNKKRLTTKKQIKVNNKNINVVIRKITNKEKKLTHIRIRISNKYIKDLFENITEIQKAFEKTGYIPKTCLWNNSGLL